MAPRRSLGSLATRWLVLTVAGLLWQACSGDEVTAPGTGVIKVTVATTGSEADPDGYTLSLDGLLGAPIEANAVRILVVTRGNHSLVLAGLAGNCAVAAEGLRRSVTVSAGDTATIGFDVVCGSSTGGLRIVTATTGTSSDSTGYAVVVGQDAPRPIGVNDTLELSGLPPGDYPVKLVDIAGNCAVNGGDSLTATVTAGDIAEATFAVVCATTGGGLRVVTATTGGIPDADGYSVVVGNDAPRPIGVNDTLELTGLEPGEYPVRLLEVAANCEVSGGDSVGVAVTTGAIVEAAFAIACTGGVEQWAPMASGTTGDLAGVWGTSGSDVFAVGQLETDVGGFQLSGIILHYDGSAWSLQDQIRDVILQDVWASSPTNAYAVGGDFLTSRAVVLHYDGTAWEELPGFDGGLGDETYLAAVWGSSASDVYVVGSTFDGEFNTSFLFHYDGSSWQPVTIAGDVLPSLADVWGSSASDVYAVGRDDVADPAAAVIMRYDGTAWVPVLQEEGLTLRAVWGSSASDVYAAGFVVGSPTAVGALRHYDGHSWTSVQIPSVGILQDIWGSSASDVFAVGQDGVVLHYDGTGWTATSPAALTLLGVWGNSPADVFAVGNAGTILHGTP